MNCRDIVVCKSLRRLRILFTYLRQPADTIHRISTGLDASTAFTSFEDVDNREEGGGGVEEGDGGEDVLEIELVV